MWKRLGIIFGIQTAIFTIATGYDQFTEGGILTFVSQHNFQISTAVILFWTIPITLTLAFETTYRFGKWCKGLLEQKYISWQLDKRKTPNLSRSDLMKTISTAHYRGQLNAEEMDRLTKLIDGVNSFDMLLLEFLDDPYSIIDQKNPVYLNKKNQNFFILFYHTFPFLKHTSYSAKSSVMKLRFMGMISIDFDDFIMKIPINSQGTNYTSSLGHKFIYLVKKIPSYS
jgi:hypothetical protein